MGILTAASPRELLPGLPRTMLAAALDLRFDLGEVDNRIAFTRASSKTRFGPLGTMETLGTNAPAIWYNPLTLCTSTTSLTVGLGTKALTLATGSQFAGGTPVRISRTSDAANTWMSGIAMPMADGSLRVIVMRSAGSGAYSDWTLIECQGLDIEEARTNLLLNSETLATQSITTTAAARTLSFYGTGSVTLSGTHSAVVTGSAANVRTTYTYTPTAGALTLTVSGSVKYANDELGASATSWIPTAGTSATRAADLCSMTGTNFSDWYSQSEGGFVVTATFSDLSAIKTIIEANDGTTSKHIRFTSDSNNVNFQVSDTTAQAALAIGIVSGKFSAAGVYKANSFAACINGGTATTDSSGTVPSLNRISIGRRISDRYLNGRISRVTYFNTRLSNSILQELSS